MAEVEAAVGRRLRRRRGPLLVSVRSGAPVSMPGMMDTILDLGLNDATEAGLAARVRRRGVRPELPRAVRGELPLDRRRRRRPRRSVGASCGSRSRPSSAPGTATAPGRIARRRGSPTTSAPPSPSRRWSSATAAPTSATGVAVHPQPGDRRADPLRRRAVRRPGRGRRRRDPRDRADRRRSTSGCRPSPPSCASDAARLEHHYADLCDIEFTIEDGRLWMLQVRVGKRSPQAALRIAVDMAEDPAFPLSRARGGRAGRAAAGRSADDHDRRGAGSVLPLVTGPAGVAGDGQRARSPRARRRPWRAAEAGRAVDPRPRRDLARRRPRDGPGGRHPDLARRPGEPRRGRRARLGDPGGGRRGGTRGPRRRGRRSAIGSSAPATSSRSTAAPARSSRARSPARPRSCPRRGRCSPGPRARHPDRRRRRAAAPPSRAGRAPRAGPVTPDACLRAIAIKGFAQPQGVADAVLATPEDVQPILDQLVVDGLVATVAGALPADRGGHERAAELLADRAGRVGRRARRRPRSTRSSTLDQRMKETVTAWQLARRRRPGRQRPHRRRLRPRRPRPARRAPRRRGRLARPRSRPAARGSAATASGSAARRSGPGRRRPLRRLAPGRQLPRRSGSSSTRTSSSSPAAPARTRSPPAARSTAARARGRAGISGPSRTPGP